MILQGEKSGYHEMSSIILILAISEITKHTPASNGTEHIPHDYHELVDIGEKLVSVSFE